MRPKVLTLVEIARGIVAIEVLTAAAIAETLGVSRATSFRLLRESKDPESDLHHVIQAVSARMDVKGKRYTKRRSITKL